MDSIIEGLEQQLNCYYIGISKMSIEGEQSLLNPISTRGGGFHPPSHILFKGEITLQDRALVFLDF